MTRSARIGFPNPFSFLFVSSKREQYLAQYVVREHARGRSLEEILADPYVLNRSTPEERARLVERPEVVEALGAGAAGGPASPGDRPSRR